MVPSEEGLTSTGALKNGGERGLIATLMCSDDLGEALTILNSATVQNVSGEYMRHGGQWLLIPHVLEQTDAPAIILAALALTAGIKAPEIWRDNTLRDALGLPSDDAGILGALSVGEKREVAPSPPRPLSVQRRDVKYLQTAAAALGVSKPLLRRPMRLATYALRRYANRLPGFSHSSFPHLWGNLLSTSGTIRIGANGFFIALSPPPLDVVWRISGAGAADYRLPDGRRVIVEVRR
jgi:hypothetical protein